MGVCGGIYYIAKGATPDLALYTTHKQATMVYADSTAVVGGTGIITGEAGATAGDIYIFEEYDQACKEGSLITSNVVSRSANTDVYHGQQYQLWDAGKIQGCKCDLGYDGPDCSHRISPHGDDPLTTVKSNMMKLAVKINGKSSATFITEQFLMVYHDPYGGIWRTDAIDGTTNDNIAASRVQDALRALPNEVLEGVKVTGTASTPSICHRFDDGVQHLSAFEDNHIGHHKDAKYSSNFCEFSHTALAPAGDDMDFTVEFANLPGRPVSSTSSRSTFPSVALAPSLCPAASLALLPTPLARSTTTPTSAIFPSSLSAPTVASMMAMASASASTASAASPARSRRPSSKSKHQAPA